MEMVGNSSGTGRAQKKEIEIIKLPLFFRIAISFTDDDYNYGWLKIDPPDYLVLDKSAELKHSHDSFIGKFSTRFVTDGVSFCKYRPGCTSECIGSTVYCVGGDQDIDANILDIFSERIGPAITMRTSTTSFPPFDYVAKNNLSHKIGSRNFFCPRGDDWKLDRAPKLLSPRYRPYIVAVGGRIFIFGGNRFPVNQLDYVPFGEVFDPETKLCSLISDPPFPNRIGFFVLFLAPFLSRDGQEEKILVMSHARHGCMRPPPGCDAAAVYDTHTDTWEPLCEPERKELYLKTYDIIGAPIPVAQQDSIYWLRSRYEKRPALICSYNWKSKHFWEGSLSGLEHESPFRRFNKPPKKILLHIYQDLFCLVWDDIAPATNDQIFTQIHFTLLRVSREDPPSSSLSAFVVGCFSRVVPLSFDVRNAYLLH